jgi:hypothetical protein
LETKESHVIADDVMSKKRQKTRKNMYNTKTKPRRPKPQLHSPVRFGEPVPEPELQARVHPHWVGGRAGYVYSIIYDGELLVERSPAPEGDAARALKAKGITGKLTLLDGKTGKPRIRIDIEKMAKLTVREDQHRMRFARWTPMPVHQKGQESGEGKPHSPEEREEAA